MCRGHVSYQGESAFTRSRRAVKGIDKGDGFNVRTFLRVKCRCQLILRLKANKCYQELLRFFSFYINLLIIRLFAQVSYCLNCSDRITLAILLILLL